MTDYGYVFSKTLHQKLKEKICIFKDFASEIEGENLCRSTCEKY